MMTQKILVLLLLNLFSLACRSQSETYFEGHITYLVDFKSKLDPDDETFGDTLVVSIKDGFIKKSYNTKQAGGLKEEIFDPDKGIIYTRIVGVDTVYWFDAKQNTNSKLKHVSSIETGESILGYECKLLTAEIEFDNSDIQYIIEERFYYSDVLRLKPSWFRNYQYGFSSKKLGIMKHYGLKYEMLTEATRMSITAIKIDNQSLDIGLFKIDEKLPLEEFKM